MEGVLTDSPHLLPYLIRHSLIEVLELYTETKVSQLDGVIGEEDVGT